MFAYDEYETNASFYAREVFEKLNERDELEKRFDNMYEFVEGVSNYLRGKEPMNKELLEHCLEMVEHYAGLGERTGALVIS